MTARKGRDYPGGNGGVVCRNWLVRASNGDRLGSFFTPKSMPGWVSNNSHWEGRLAYLCSLRSVSRSLRNSYHSKDRLARFFPPKSVLRGWSSNLHWRGRVAYICFLVLMVVLQVPSSCHAYEDGSGPSLTPVHVAVQGGPLGGGGEGEGQVVHLPEL